jgi:hypothetical protein
MNNSNICGEDRGHKRQKLGDHDVGSTVQVELVDEAVDVRRSTISLVDNNREDRVDEDENEDVDGTGDDGDSHAADDDADGEDDDIAASDGDYSDVGDDSDDVSGDHTSDSSEDSFNGVGEKAALIISNIVAEHNARIRELKISGALVDRVDIEGKDFYMHGAVQPLLGRRCLNIWDGLVTQAPLVSIPVDKSFITACLHPRTGRLVAALELTIEYGSCVICCVLDTMTSEMISGFHCVCRKFSYPQVTFSASGNHILTNDYGKSFSIFDPVTGDCARVFKNCLSCSFTLADECLITYSILGKVRVWEIGKASIDEICSYQMAKDSGEAELNICCSWFAPLAAIGISGYYTVWDYRSQKKVLDIPEYACDAVFARGDAVIILRTDGERIEVWSLASGTRTFFIAEELTLNEKLCYVFSRNALVHCRMGEDYVEYMGLWDVGSGVCVQRLNHAGTEILEYMDCYSEPVALLLGTLIQIP